MRIKVLGCSGGGAPGKLPSCYLLENGVSVDAGALASGLQLDEQLELTDVFLTHSHWDHVRDLPFTVINRNIDLPALTVHGLADTVAALRTHLMNDVMWFAAFDLPSPMSPFIASETIAPGETKECKGYRFTAIEVPHTVPAISYLVDDGEAAALICADTKGNGFLGRLPEGGSPLKAVIIEASFPNRMGDFAILTGHMTPEMLGREVAELPDDVLVYVTHMKPGFEDEIMAELDALGRPGLAVCEQGAVLEL